MDSVRLTGSWHFNLKTDSFSYNIGPQVGSGKLDGLLLDSSIQINLNPNMMDNNVFLIGKMDQEAIQGKWIYSTYFGATSWGSFEAKKIK